MDARATTDRPVSGPLIRPGASVWRAPRADRAACLVDNETYFRLVKHAIARAERSILIVGWAFDPRTRLDPLAGDDALPDAIGELLNAAIAERPDLEIGLLIWNMVLPIAATLDLFPHRAAYWLDERIKLRLADDVPLGACHHQKMVIVDDSLAFVSGDDISPDRWDTSDHADAQPARELATGIAYQPHHGLTMMLEGEVAQSLSEAARERWLVSTGEALPPPGPLRAGLWPEEIAPDFTGIPVGIARTLPARHGNPAVRESESLLLDAIAAARRLIYVENQYFASQAVGDAIARRLSEPDGPEVVAIVSPHSPSYFDRMVMDAARDALLAELRTQDPHGRLHVLAPYTREGRPVIVHAKTMIVDDALVRIGSANLNNRSLGFDTELDVAIEAPEGAAGAAVRARIDGLVDRFAGHFVGVAPEVLAAARARTGSLARALETLDGGKRLVRLEPTGPGFFGALTARRHLGDPTGAETSFRPWKRRPGPARLTAGHALAAGALGALAGFWVARTLRRDR